MREEAEGEKLVENRKVTKRRNERWASVRIGYFINI